MSQKDTQSEENSSECATFNRKETTETVISQTLSTSE